jgi:hypothetical protein
MDKLPGETELVRMLDRMEERMEATGEIPDKPEVVRRIVQRLYEVVLDMPGVHFLEILTEVEKRRGAAPDSSEEPTVSDEVIETDTKTTWSSW